MESSDLVAIGDSSAVAKLPARTVVVVMVGPPQLFRIIRSAPEEARISTVMLAQVTLLAP